MSASGYTGAAVEAGSSAAVTISNLYIYGIAILGAIMIFILLFYKLDKEYPQIIKERLSARLRPRRTNLSIRIFLTYIPLTAKHLPNGRCFAVYASI